MIDQCKTEILLQKNSIIENLQSTERSFLNEASKNPRFWKREDFEFWLTYDSTVVLKNHMITPNQCTTCEVKDGSIRTDPETGEEKTVKLGRCNGCLMVWYCGKKCQSENWPYHKPNCIKWRTQIN